MPIRGERKRPRKKSVVHGVIPWLIVREAAAQLLAGDSRWPSDSVLRAWLAAVPLGLIRSAIRNPRLTPLARARPARPAWHELARAQRRELREDGYSAARRWYERPGALGQP